MARGSIEYKSTANEVPNIVGICQEMEREVTFDVLGSILVEKPPPKVTRVRRRAETRDSFLEGSLQ